MCDGGVVGKDFWLHGVSIGHRSQPQQTSSHIRDGASKEHQRGVEFERKGCKPQQVHLLSNEEVFFIL